MEDSMGLVCTGRAEPPRTAWAGPAVWHNQPVLVRCGCHPGWVPLALTSSLEGRGAADASSLGQRPWTSAPGTREVGFPWMPSTPAHRLHTQRSTSSFQCFVGDESHEHLYSHQGTFFCDKCYRPEIASTD